MILYEFHRKERQQIFYKDKQDPVAWYELTIGTYKKKARLHHCTYDELDARQREIKEDIGKTLEKWKRAIEELDRSNNTCYLLFDFSDQSTSWIKCTLVDEELELQVGWSTHEGYHWDGVNKTWVEKSLPNFTPESENFVFPRKEIILRLTH